MLGELGEVLANDPDGIQIHFFGVVSDESPAERVGGMADWSLRSMAASVRAGTRVRWASVPIESPLVSRAVRSCAPISMIILGNVWRLLSA